ncbi:hypothetical protein ACT0XK_004373 [Cronobacter sakazakii]|uniref:hypothetical protein n=1 Tax=Cronobacter sakazakii TaxID=28141 RepID=UPI000BE8C444|nr:hypothetical protein [Cronobacter sakazakii]ELY5945197.1 hypothetical protein [Cronobacter turicensis]EJV9475505.1 hypothetical protein [Cronobacter sakazakii]EKK7733779.1 hypothetical protein [Cronobacter sakazakii]ELY4124900.1 hypothetical protein [Cronobacter sakazakii]ELY7546267.1 hypothetical protein [Cronobacter turicensis]
MITYITDQQNGEPDILAPLQSETLIIKSLEGKDLLKVAAPKTGWTHEALCAIQSAESEEGADAYLGAQWVGSTEV